MTAPAQSGKIKIDGVVYELPESLTVGEMVDAELALGVALPKLDPESMAMQLAMSYIAMKRERPRTTWAEFCRYDISAFMEVEAEELKAVEPKENGTPAPPPTAPAKRSKTASPA